VNPQTARVPGHYAAGWNSAGPAPGFSPTIMTRKKDTYRKQKPIAMSQWGKDHWSTLAYIECRCVDHGGVPDRRHMRANPELHPQFAHIAWEDDIPTRRKGGKLKHNHDDWSCVDDMVAEGLVRWLGTGMNPVFKLTERGLAVCTAIRKHKASGGNFAGFIPPPEDTLPPRPEPQDQDEIDLREALHLTADGHPVHGYAGPAAPLGPTP